MRKIIYPGLLFFATALHAQTILRPGMKITASVKIKPGIYRINTTTELFTSVIEIEGNNIVVDFRVVIAQVGKVSSDIGIF